MEKLIEKVIWKYCSFPMWDTFTIPENNGWPERQVTLLKIYHCKINRFTKKLVRLDY
jgi:hypothetical protein